MSPRPSGAFALLVVALAALAVLGCSSEPTMELRSWSFVRADGAEVPVVLPAHLDAMLPPSTPSRYTLRTRATLPEVWRGQALTLAIPFLEGPTALRVDGRPAAALESSLVPGRPSLSSQSFRIDGAESDRGALTLELEVDRLSTRAAWIDTVPRVSATPSGDRAFLAVRMLNGPVVVAGFAVVSMVGFVFFALYLLDRRRPVPACFVLQAAGIAYYLLEQLGVPQAVFGPHFFGSIALSLSTVAGVYFITAYFGLAVPGLSFRLVSVALFVIAALMQDPFAAPGFVYKLGPPLVVAYGAYQIVLLWRAYRLGTDRVAAALLLIAWAITLAVAGPTDAPRYLGIGELAGGAHALVLGAVTYAVAQAFVLSRDHIRSLQTADALNVELKARVAMLEERARENALLSDELRRQIADRSQRLADALARIGAVPLRTVMLAAGDEIHGRYRIVRALGEGGMGAVYEVERTTDQRRLALKVLTAASTGVALARLAREAQVAAQASHENLVSILDVDVSEAGALYIVMELVDGAPLHGMADRYGDGVWARGILLQVARGLVALHAHGVVHRDLKPANVLITKDGVAKIADFGIARLGADTTDPLAATEARVAPHELAVAPTISAADTPLTATGMLMGTPLYMAPELGRGAKSAEPSSDVFSFGLLAYELVTGRLPFAMPPVLSAMAGRGLPGPAPFEEGVFPGELAAMLLRCLDLDPARRPSAADLAALLDGAVT